MSHSFEGARLIQISSGSSHATPDPEDSSDETTTHIESPSGNITVHKHSSGDHDFLAVPIVATVFVFLWLIVKAIMAPFHHKNRVAGQPMSGGLSEQEVAILHKLERTLSQMESRVEALETILIDQNRPTAKNYGPKF